MSSTEREDHLSEEELGELLAGGVSGERTRVHLTACSACRQELDLLQDSLGHFGAMSLRWAEVEAPRKVHVPSRLALRLGGKPSWGLAVAAAVMVVVAGVGLRHPEAKPGTHQSASLTRAESPSNTELAEDNRLLESIRAELQYEVHPTVPAAELRVSGSRDGISLAAPVQN